MRPRMPFRPCSMPPSLQGRAQQTGFRACRRRQASSPARATASASLASSDAASAFAECQRAAAGECGLEGLRRQFDKTQREGEETRRLSLPRHVARHPRSLAQVEVGLGQSGQAFAQLPARGRRRPGGTRMSSGCSRSRW